MVVVDNTKLSVCIPAFIATQSGKLRYDYSWCLSQNDYKSKCMFLGGKSVVVLCCNTYYCPISASEDLSLLLVNFKVILTL